MNQLHHFYHIYCKGNWEVPTQQHIEALQKYGLLNNLTSFQVGLVGPPDRRQQVKDYLNSLNIKYMVCNEVDDGWEQETQDKMWEFSQFNDGFVLYAHTKNAVNINPLHIRWRRSMTYYTVVIWSECVRLLSEGVSATGSHYLPSSNNEVHSMSGFFGGTFWWTHLKYMRKFPKPWRRGRHDAEGWIGFLKETVEGNGEQLRIHDFNPSHPAEDSGMKIEW
jgi:hypothetical protein